MKINLNKSTKRALSLVLAFAMLIGSLFTANIGINISADAATAGKIWTYSGTPATSIANVGGGDGSSADNAIIIASAEELAYLAKGCGDTRATQNLCYKIADGVDAIVLQDTQAEAEAIMALTTTDEVTTYFTNNKSSLTKWVDKAWADSDKYGFEGVLDGNGVTVYGMYSIPSYYNYSTGLFPDIGGATIKNLAIKNSYVQGNSSAVLSAYSDLSATITVQGCEFINNVVINERNPGSLGHGGVIFGAISKSTMAIDNCIVYGNIAKHASFELEFGLFGSNNGGTISNSLIFDVWPSALNRSYASAFRQTYTNVYSNMWYDGATHTYTDNTGTAAAPVLTTYEYTYALTSSGVKLTIKNTTDSTVSDISEYCTSTNYPHNVTYLSSDDAKGSMGKLIMNLDWATDEEDGTWYAIDGEYPTLFRPEGWKDCATITTWDGTANDNGGKFAADAEGNYGDGTAEKPYLIETPEQLFAMVKSGGKVDDKPAYYKVKDGVTDLYLSRAISGGYAAVKSLASGTEGTDYYNWNPNAWTVFEGNFDGNGVTIRGMISKSTDNFKQVGLIGVFGEDAVVKNINFDTCYAYNTHDNNSALLASQVIFLGNEDADSEQKVDNGGAKDGYNLIYNVSVRNSSIKSKGNNCCAGLVCSYNGFPDMLQVVNSLFDGYSCELGNGQSGNANAGMVAYNWGINNAQFSGCVSLGAPIASNRTTDTAYNDYRTDKDGAQYTDPDTDKKSYVCHPVYTFNCYTDVKEVANTTAIELVDENGASIVKDATADETLVNNMPLLDWANGWYVATDADGRKVPMPRVRTAADVTATWDTGEAVLTYNVLVGTDDGGAGSTPYNGRNGRFDKFIGSGTENDPYLISTPLELARAIGAGGTKLNNRLYFKLACDIDVSGMPWLDTVGCSLRSGKFTYVPFVGVLDGDGHTITGLYAVSNDGVAGLIPELASTGIVKNLHIRDSHIASSKQYQPYKWVTDDFGTATEIDAENPVTNTNTAGAIAGKTAADAQIIGCSVENTTVVNTADGMTADGNATVKNSYIDDTYYNADGAKVTADAITVDYGTDAENPVWYMGGAEGSTPQLVNRAKAMPVADIVGDGNGYEYDTNDLVPLRYKLLRKSAYQNIYGDANKDGVVNSADLVIVQRAKVGDYEDVKDGFWRNVEVGKVAIYYSENDTQDMARKLELYFESEIPGIDMMKYATSEETVTDSSLIAEDFKAAPAENAVIITQGDPTNVAYNEYSVTYDSAKNLVTIYGGSFTAVEQAVIYFMANSDRATGDIYEIEKGDILTEKLTDTKTVLSDEDSNSLVTHNTTTTESSYKQKVTVGGVDYYYAWGDEFEGVDDTISSDIWTMNSYRAENPDGSTSMYTNKENANLEDLKTLWVCQDGRLSIWRGVNTAVNNDSSTWGWGYQGIDLGVNTTNDWNKTIDDADAYIDPGLITTKDSMLFKQGYVEMEASLPSDGHAFPAWWFLTYSGDKNNTTISNSLYGKVFKENSNWVNTNTANYTPSDPSTYKYQLPSAHLELDIVEPMQTLYSGTANTAFKYPTSSSYKMETDTSNHYKRDFSVTVHKIYDENADANNLYIIDWANNSKLAKTIARADFISTSSPGVDWIHRYNGDNYFDHNGDVYDGYSLGGTLISSGTEAAASYNMARKMTSTVKYGFSWSVDVANKKYDLKIYVDLNGDGTMADSEMVMAINENTGHETDKIVSDPTYTGAGTDAELWNQYAYMLLDNAFYASSQGKVDGNNVPYKDLLSQETTGGEDYEYRSGGTVWNPTYSYVNNYKIEDKTTFDINYVRVYQQDGMRDIVTRDTENFNNGDHFGYGK